MQTNKEIADQFGAHIADTHGVEALHDLAYGGGGHFRYVMAVWMKESNIKSRNAGKTTMDALLYFNPGYWKN